jgi:ubiquinone/menaquinone biosynthesis C-methylase UbiE/uncharacterized protein YbaR (Trm112 family)
MTRCVWEPLRCPQHPDEGRLAAQEGRQGSSGATDCVGTLKCLACGRVYPVMRGIVDMLEPLPPTDLARAYLEAESQQWDQHASQYDARRSQDVSYLSCLRAGLRSLQARTGDLILDAGCGTGMGTRMLHHAGISTVALDLSMASLERLSTHMTTSGIRYVRANICRLPFASKVFDRLICANTLQHLPAWDLRQRCVEQFARVVKPAGTVVVTAHGFSVSKRRAGWTKEGTARSSSGDVQYIYRYEVQEFRDLLARNLRVESITGAGLPLPYRFKLSPLSVLLERVLSRWQRCAPWGHMLVGKCLVG